ncbi:MAG: N-acetylmuramidase family protein, partial [Hyphomonadaceae bacterium]
PLALRRVYGYRGADGPTGTAKGMAMSFWDTLFRVLFGNRSAAPASPPPPPAPRPAPPPAAPPAAPPPAAPPPAAPPAPPAAPPPAAPPAAPPPAAPPSPPASAGGAPAGFSLDGLRAQDASKLGQAQIDALAQRLGVEGAVIKAVVTVESAGAGFASDGRPLILFEPFWFSQATGGRFDASNPQVSQPTIRSADLGGNQAARWQKVQQAFALAPEAALGATSWGAFQTPGRYYAACGFSSVYAFVQDVSISEAQQLAVFERYLRSQGLVDALSRKDWQAFARGYEGEQGAGQYSTALANAYAQLVRQSGGSSSFIDSLVAETRAALTRDDYAAVAGRLGCETEAVQAVVQVESGASGFAADGRPIILYEPHIFSRLTSHRFDASNPNVSYPSWDASRYPRDQAGRYAQLREAYGLDPEAAVASASWGLFQILGTNHSRCGFPTATAFVADMSKSHARQLAAFEAFVRSGGLADELQRKDWGGFARGYNGPGQVERYGRLLADAYARVKGAAPSA